jgi:hypothetical protein
LSENLTVLMYYLFMKYELGIVIDPYARTSARRRIERFIVQAKHPLLITDGHTQTSDRLLAAGGDKTIREAVKKAHEQDAPLAIGVVKGGTLNAFYRFLTTNGYTTTLEDFATSDDISSFYQLRPGIVNNEIVITAAGFGGFETNYAMLHQDEKFRKVPRDIHPYALAVLSVLQLLKDSQTTNKPISNAIFVVSQSGPVRGYYRDENPQELLAQAKIPGESQAQAVLKGAYSLVHSAITGKPFLPREHMRFADSFTIPEHEQLERGRNLDGEWIKEKPRGDIFVYRSDKAIPVVAIR